MEYLVVFTICGIVVFGSMWAIRYFAEKDADAALQARFANDKSIAGHLIRETLKEDK